MISRALLAAVLLAAGNPAFADDAAQRGRAVVEQWCRLCHLRAGDAPDADMAPPFETIATWPGRDRVYLERFMKDDHFPMTTFRLFEDEKRDVVAYLLSLRR